VDETTWDKMASDLYHLGKTSGYIGARAYNSGNLTIPNGVATALTFDSERFDSDTIHSVAVSTGRLTCQTAGVYHIMGQVRWAVDADGYRAAYIRLNGATTIASVIHVSASAGVSNDIIVSCHYQLALNDYVELVVYHTAGGDLAVAKTVLGKKVNPMLADFQKFTWTYDTDKDGKAELHEVVAVLKAKGIGSIRDMDKDGDLDIRDVDAMIRAQNKGAAKPQKGK